jgi:hypothetical protein
MELKDKEIVDQAAAQAAQQAAQQVAEAVSQAIQKFLQSTGTSTAGTGVFTRAELADIGGSEAHERGVVENSGLLFSNNKRTYDEYQEVSLESIKRNRSYIDKTLSDAQSYDNQARNIANQALQNAVETANMVGKQAVRHGDIAIDGQWNPVQQGAADTMVVKAVQLDDASVKAIAAALAAAFASATVTKA